MQQLPLWRRLRAAIIQDDAAAIEAVITQGADPNQLFELGEHTQITPLMFAVQRVPSQNSLAAVRALLRSGANVNLPSPQGLPLIFAVSVNHRELVEELLACGADINAIQNAPTVKSYTALHAACHFGHFELACMLIRRGAHLNMQGTTPLHLATFSGNRSIMHRLIDCGADVNAPDHSGRTPLHHACLLRVPLLIQLLLNEGADIDAVDCTGKVPALGPEMENAVKESRKLRKIP